MQVLDKNRSLFGWQGGHQKSGYFGSKVVYVCYKRVSSDACMLSTRQESESMNFELRIRDNKYDIIRKEEHVVTAYVINVCTPPHKQGLHKVMYSTWRTPGDISTTPFNLISILIPSLYTSNLELKKIYRVFIQVLVLQNLPSTWYAKLSFYEWNLQHDFTCN